MHENEYEFNRKIIMSGEAHFCLGGYVNNQNCRIWGLDNPKMIIGKPLYPQRVTLWCGFWAGGIMGPYLFEIEAEVAISVNGLNYRAMINAFLWPELEDMDVDDVSFQQDGATCHTSSEPIGLLRQKFPAQVISRNGVYNWPPRSCILTPLDCFLWGYVKDKVYAVAPQSIQELKEDLCRHRRNRASNVQKCNSKCHQKETVLQT